MTTMWILYGFDPYPALGKGRKDAYIIGIFADEEGAYKAQYDLYTAAGDDPILLCLKQIKVGEGP